MKARSVLGLMTLLILSISYSLFSSNTGFKLKMSLNANEAKFISLPYYNSYTDAESLRNRIMRAQGSGVSVYNYNGTQWQRWSGGGIGQINFAIEPGIGYEVVSTSNVSNWLIVGSHNENLSFSFQGAVNKFISLPYHTTLKNAAELRNSIISAGANWVNLYRWTGSKWQRWSGGGIGQVNFDLEPGIAVQVVCYPDVTDWKPPHY
jgi:hypothetical protein